MAFKEIQFPTTISYGSAGGPGFNTKVISTPGGQEQRVSGWSTPLRRYDVVERIRKQTDLHSLVSFYSVVQGAVYGFRYKDWFDFTTAADGIAAPADDDQTLGTGDGTTTTFQLKKTYTASGQSVSRNIQKPVTGTVVVAIGGTNQSSGWTVDVTTGIITFGTAPTAGEVVSAGCEFDVPVRFSEELDDLMQVSLDEFESGSISSVPLIEIRPSDGVTYEDAPMGGAKQWTLTGVEQTISIGLGRVHTFAYGSGSSHSVKFPALTNIEPGGPVFFLVNEDVSAGIAIKNSAGTTLMTLADGEAVTVVVTLNAASTKGWRFL